MGWCGTYRAPFPPATASCQAADVRAVWAGPRVSAVASGMTPNCLTECFVWTGVPLALRPMAPSCRHPARIGCRKGKYRQPPEWPGSGARSFTAIKAPRQKHARGSSGYTTGRRIAVCVAQPVRKVEPPPGGGRLWSTRIGRLLIGCCVLFSWRSAERVGRDPALLSQSLISEFAKPGTADHSYEFATDTFVIRNGKIVAQSFAAKASPKS